MLPTNLCKLLGIEVPIVSAGMGGGGHALPVARAPLTAAVSEAGGLGVLGAGGLTPDEVREEVRLIRTMTDKPFGVDIFVSSAVRADTAPLVAEPPAALSEAIEGLRAQLELPSRSGQAPVGALSTAEELDLIHTQLLEDEVPVIVYAGGYPGEYLTAAADTDTITIALVGNQRQARKCVAGGVDALVAVGLDAGGHNGTIGTFSLVPQIVDASGGVPVLAGGGVSDGRGVAAAMALGASGVWVGTRFLVCEEADTNDAYRQALIEADSTEAVMTRWFTGKPARALRNDVVTYLDSSGCEPLPMPAQGAAMQHFLSDSCFEQDRRAMFVGAGQAVGMVSSLSTAAEIVAELVSDAGATIDALAGGDN